MEKPFEFALSRVPWSLFVTLTFVRETMPLGLRRKYWFAFARRVAELAGVHFHDLLWLLRLEYGESTGRLHNHALIGGLPDRVLTERFCLVLMSVWEHQKPLCKRTGPDGQLRELSRFCGMPRVRIYSPSLDGLGYVLPDSDGEVSGYSLSGANSYEARKFGWAETVECSLSVRRLVSRRLRGCSAKAVQRTPREVSGSYHPAGAWVPSSPALPSRSPAITGATAVHQVPAIKPPHTGRKTTWRDLGTGVYELVGA